MVRTAASDRLMTTIKLRHGRSCLSCGRAQGPRSDMIPIRWNQDDDDRKGTGLAAARGQALLPQGDTTNLSGTYGFRRRRERSLAKPRSALP